MSPFSIIEVYVDEYAGAEQTLDLVTLCNNSGELKRD